MSNSVAAPSAAVSTPTVVLLERRGGWATLLRQAAAGEPLRLVETRSEAELLEQIAAQPAAAVAVELTAAAPLAALRQLARLRRRFADAALVMLAERAAEPHRPVALELGATHWIASPRRICELLQMAQRCAAAGGR